MRCLQLRIPRFTGKGAGDVKLPVAAALACSAFVARLFLIPSRSASRATSVQCLSRPGTGTTDTGKSASMPASTLRWKPITSNSFPENKVNYCNGELGFPDQPCPGAAVHRPRPGHAPARHRRPLDITERSAHAIITDLTAAGY